MKKGDVKAMAIVVGGVMVAGLIMSQFRRVGLIDQARSGYS